MKRLCTFIVLVTGVFLFAKQSLASEGTFELRTTDSDYSYKCFAASLQRQDRSYKVIYSCRNLVFPIDETIYTYVLWSNPMDGGKPTKFGSIGLGRGEFTTKTAFTSLFVTAEQSSSVKEPVGKVVMKGSIKPITFLEEDTSTEEEAKESEQAEEAEEEETTSETQSSVRERLLTGLKRAGLASGLALIAILGLVFVLTRPR